MLFIDGYNLLFRLNGDHPTLQTGRDELILELHKRLAHQKKEATIVFDSAYTQGEGTHTSLAYLHIIYTAAKETADEWIYDRIRISKKPSQHTVVTSDRTLAKNIRRLGAKVLSLDTFLKALQKIVLPTKRSVHPPHTDYYLKIFEFRYQQLKSPKK